MNESAGSDVCDGGRPVRSKPHSSGPTQGTPMKIDMGGTPGTERGEVTGVVQKARGVRREENGMATPRRGEAMAPRFDLHPPGRRTVMTTQWNCPYRMAVCDAQMCVARRSHTHPICQREP